MEDSRPNLPQRANNLPGTRPQANGSPRKATRLSQQALRLSQQSPQHPLQTADFEDNLRKELDEYREEFYNEADIASLIHILLKHSISSQETLLSFSFGELCEMDSENLSKQHCIKILREYLKGKNEWFHQESLEEFVIMIAKYYLNAPDITKYAGDFARNAKNTFQNWENLIENFSNDNISSKKKRKMLRPNGLEDKKYDQIFENLCSAIKQSLDTIPSYKVKEIREDNIATEMNNLRTVMEQLQRLIKAKYFRVPWPVWDFQEQVANYLSELSKLETQLRCIKEFKLRVIDGPRAARLNDDECARIVRLVNKPEKPLEAESKIQSETDFCSAFNIKLSEHANIFSVFGATGVGKSCIIRGCLNSDTGYLPAADPLGQCKMKSTTAGVCAYRTSMRNLFLGRDNFPNAALWLREPLIALDAEGTRGIQDDDSFADRNSLVERNLSVLLYCVSNVIVYMVKADLGDDTNIKELKCFASGISQATITYAMKPALIVLVNKCAINPNLEKLKKSMGEETCSVFRDIAVVTIPNILGEEGMATNLNYATSQFLQLADKIRGYMEEPLRRKGNFHMTFSVFREISCQICELRPEKLDLSYIMAKYVVQALRQNEKRIIEPATRFFLTMYTALKTDADYCNNWRTAYTYALKFLVFHYAYKRWDQAHRDVIVSEIVVKLEEFYAILSIFVPCCSVKTVAEFLEQSPKMTAIAQRVGIANVALRCIQTCEGHSHHSYCLTPRLTSLLKLSQKIEISKQAGAPKLPWIDKNNSPHPTPKQLRDFIEETLPKDKKVLWEKIRECVFQGLGGTNRIDCLTTCKFCQEREVEYVYGCGNAHGICSFCRRNINPDRCPLCSASEKPMAPICVTYLEKIQPKWSELLPDFSKDHQSDRVSQNDNKVVYNKKILQANQEPNDDLFFVISVVGRCSDDFAKTISDYIYRIHDPFKKDLYDTFGSFFFAVATKAATSCFVDYKSPGGPNIRLVYYCSKDASQRFDLVLTSTYVFFVEPPNQKLVNQLRTAGVAAEKLTPVALETLINQFHKHKPAIVGYPVASLQFKEPAQVAFSVSLWPCLLDLYEKMEKCIVVIGQLNESSIDYLISILVNLVYAAVGLASVEIKESVAVFAEQSLFQRILLLIREAIFFEREKSPGGKTDQQEWLNKATSEIGMFMNPTPWKTFKMSAFAWLAVQRYIAFKTWLTCEAETKLKKIIEREKICGLCFELCSTEECELACKKHPLCSRCLENGLVDAFMRDPYLLQRKELVVVKECFNPFLCIFCNNPLMTLFQSTIVRYESELGHASFREIVWRMVEESCSGTLALFHQMNIKTLEKNTEQSVLIENGNKCNCDIILAVPKYSRTSNSEYRRLTGSEIGSPSSSKASLYNLKENRPMVVKKLYCAKNQLLWSDVFKEATMASICSGHPCVAKFIGADLPLKCRNDEEAINSDYYLNCENAYLMWEYHQNTLDRVLIYSDSRISLPRALYYLMTAARGILFLHNLGLVHRDIKPHNILIESITDRALIIDFGQTITYKSAMATQVGTCRWRAPEIIDCAFYSSQIDIFSFGVMCFDIFCQSTDGTLFYNFWKLKTWRECTEFLDKKEHIDKILEMGNQFDCSDKWTQLIDCIKRCLSKSPYARPTMSDILHKFSDALLDKKMPEGLWKQEAEYCKKIKSCDMGAEMDALLVRKIPPLRRIDVADPVGFNLFGALSFMGIKITREKARKFLQEIKCELPIEGLEESELSRPLDEAATTGPKLNKQYKVLANLLEISLVVVQNEGELVLPRAGKPTFVLALVDSIFHPTEKIESY